MAAGAISGEAIAVVRSAPRWALWSAVLLIGVALAFGGWWLVRSNSLTASEHRRNIHELDIATRLIESWPSTIRWMAVANLLPSRIEAVPPSEAARGWAKAVRFHHPTLGAITILYGLPKAGTCAPKSMPGGGAQGSVGSVTFPDARQPRMTIAGTLPISEMWYSDELALQNGEDVQPFQPQVDGPAFLKPLGITAAKAPDSICFRADLPLDNVVDLPETAPKLEKLLLVDRSGNLLAQLGGAPLPMSNISELNRLRPALDQIIAVAESRTTPDKAPTVTKSSATETDEAVDRSAPAPVTIGGHDYYAYTRSLNLPAGFPATACGVATDGLVVAPTATPTENPRDRSASCLAIGLVPAGTVNAAALALPPAVTTAFALLLTMVVALLPLVKLRMIGPSDSLTRVEVVSIVMGITTAVAVSTLIMCVAASLIRDDRKMADRAAQVADWLVDDFAKELTATMSLPAQWQHNPPGNAYRPAVPALPAALACPDPGRRARPKTPITDHDVVPEQLFQQDAGGGWWPVRESITLFGEWGAAWPGYAPVSNRCEAGSRSVVTDRAYFKALMRGDTDGDVELWETAAKMEIDGKLSVETGYKIAAVRSLPDGIEKVVIARRLQPSPTAKKKPPMLGPASGALVQAMVPRSFLRPVLPEPLEFMVVDASDSRTLPVLFSSNPYRIEVDRIADDIQSAGARVEIQNAACDAIALGPKGKEAAKGWRESRCDNRVADFHARYEGLAHHFIAHGLVGTPWVLLVHFPDDAVARPLAEAAVLTGGTWAGVVLAVALVLIAAGALWLHRRLWEWAWPKPGAAESYRSALVAALWVMGGAIVLALVLSSFDIAEPRLVRVLVALLTAPAIVWLTAWRIDSDAASAGHQSRSGRFLDPADERAYRKLAIVLIATVGAAPMLAIWLDARGTTTSEAAAAHWVGIDAAINANIAAHNAILAALGTERPISQTKTPPQAPREYGIYARESLDAPPQDIHPIARASDWGWTETLRDWSIGHPPARPSPCGLDASVRPFRAAVDTVYCGPPPGDGGNPAHQPTEVVRAPGTDTVKWVAIGLLAIGLVVLLLSEIDSILRCLFGHGVPLEAVTYPGIGRRRHRLDIPPKALILNAPLALRNELLEYSRSIDVSDPVARGAVGEGDTVVVTGLALALRDREIRLRALEQLEDWSRQVNIDQRRGRSGTRLVVVTDLSPLDRILQAYETEQALAGPDRLQRAEDGRREQLRWSRLFESFATIGFAPTNKYPEATIGIIGDGPEDDPYSPNEKIGIVTLINEVRGLPEVVIESLGCTPNPRLLVAFTRMAKKGHYPFNAILYKKLYLKPVIEWASRVRPASYAAAIDYLRGNLIEHYQYSWIASSHAERVILDSLARGRTVNIASALALRPLVRRGLVRLAPVPRLVNESFAAFVRQAEKPMQIQRWREEQPLSQWQRASLPLMLVVLLAIVVLVVMVANSGDHLLGLLPLVLGSAPALIGTLSGLRRKL